ncbi:hypothetical protein WDW37_18275 [Bdellovibrionota bacterium FG-1]
MIRRIQEMVLAIQVFALSLCMFTFSAGPLYWSRVQRHSRALFLVGTGALLGICVFDLVPDVFDLGGRNALILTGVVWVAYSAVHSMHYWGGHSTPGDLEIGAVLAEPKRFFFFLGPLLAHGFASGMLLTVSQGFAARMAASIFLALITHKVYESLMLSTLLQAVRRPMAWRLKVVAAYSLALPVGALLAVACHGLISNAVVVLISSLAVGTLLGCLVFDFVIPSFRQLKTSFWGWTWISVGLLLSRAVISHL